MSDDLRDRHIVVTGGTGALGGAVLELLLARGATCHVPCVEPAVPAYFKLASHERVHAVAGVDLASEESTAGFYGALPPLWASIQLAGGFAMTPLLETKKSDLEAMLSLNAVTCFLCCREAARAIGRAGAGGGRLVNVAARPAVRPVAGMAAYIASKAAVAALTQAMAEELLPKSILVNAILPSIIDTPANRKAMPGADFASWPKPAELAETIAFLASPGNALTTGALVPVYGRG
jgi:NAD(P)-dependent dehydrogenase (short-subunit alcohol dehydrogenase family)